MALLGRAFLDFDKQTLRQKCGGWHFLCLLFYLTWLCLATFQKAQSTQSWLSATQQKYDLKCIKVLKTSKKIVLNTGCFLAIMIQCLSLVSYQFETQQRSLLPTKQQKQNETRICYIHQGSIEDFLLGGSLSWKTFWATRRREKNF